MSTENSSLCGSSALEGKAFHAGASVRTGSEGDDAVVVLPYTGERLVPGKVPEALFREHEARYVFAGQFVAGKDVLDVACGTGTGTSYLLRAGARNCIGLDIDKGAVDYAKASYNGCAFAQSDATDLTLRAESVDVVVSFETIEHVNDQHKFLAECRRVLRPGGLLICSTPNHAISRWWEHNPFHVHELGVSEFRQLVEGRFGNAKLYAQETKLYPVYVCQVVLLPMLERLRVKEVIKRVIGYKSSPLALRNEFVGNTGNSGGEIGPYRFSPVRQPRFLIAVANKPET